MISPIKKLYQPASLLLLFTTLSPVSCLPESCNRGADVQNVETQESSPDTEEPSIPGRAVVIARNKAFIHIKPDMKSTIYEVVRTNSIVEILPNETGNKEWEKITTQYMQGRYGWVERKHILSMEHARRAWVKERAIMLHEGPDESTPVITEIPYRAELKHLERTGPGYASAHRKSNHNWWKVRWRDREGWVIEELLSFAPVPDYGILPGEIDEGTALKAIESYYRRKQRFGESRKEVLEKLGYPLKTEEKKIPAKHSNDPDEKHCLAELYYPGLRIVILEWEQCSKSSVVEVDAFDARYFTGDDPLYGQPDRAIFRLFGFPAEDNETMFQYECFDYCSFRVYTKNSRVNRVHWKCWPD